MSKGAKLFNKEFSRSIRSLVTAEVDDSRIHSMIHDMVKNFRRRFEDNQLNMFNLKKAVHIEKPVASFDHLVALLEAIKLENMVKVSAMVRHFDSKFLSMHDHVSYPTFQI